MIDGDDVGDEDDDDEYDDEDNVVNVNKETFVLDARSSQSFHDILELTEVFPQHYKELNPVSLFFQLPDCFVAPHHVM